MEIPTQQPYSRIASLLLADNAVPEPQRDSFWDDNLFRAMEGTYQVNLLVGDDGRLVRNPDLWSGIDKGNCKFQMYSSKEVVDNSNPRKMICTIFRGKVEGNSMGGVRETYHLVPESGNRISRIHIVQRNARAKRKESRSSLTPHASIVRELIPFHTFRFAVHWPTPQVTPSDEWRNLFTNMYAIDLWRVDADYRRYLCTLTLTQMRVIAAQKLSSVFTPDGFDLVPPTIAPVAFKLDAKDEEKLRETTEILARPYVRLCLPYFIWFARKEKYYDSPHWSGGRYRGCVVDGLPHKQGRVEMLLPGGGEVIYDGGFNYGQLQGIGTLEALDSQKTIIWRYRGEFREDQRYLGEQEWFTNGVLSKTFSGKWLDEQPADGVWIYTSEEQASAAEEQAKP